MFVFESEESGTLVDTEVNSSTYPADAKVLVVLGEIVHRKELWISLLAIKLNFIGANFALKERQYQLGIEEELFGPIRVDPRPGT